MKRILIGMLLLLSAVACRKEDDTRIGAPSVTRIRTEAGTALYAWRGESVEIVGNNLIKVNSVTFNGCEADLTTAVIKQQRILLTIPIAAPTIADCPVEDQVVVSTDGGAISCKLILLPPSPVMTGMSNTLPEVGERVILEGENLFYLKKVVFPGRRPLTVADYKVDEAGKTLEVIVPEGYDPAKGPIRVQTQSGEATIQPDVPEKPEPPLEALVVTGLKYLPTVTYAAWQVKENLQEGDLTYVDRTTMTMGYLPEFYKGALWISTAVDGSGYIAADPLVSFQVNRACDVYIAYNQGTVGWATWFADWQKMELGEQGRTQIEVGTDKFTVYMKHYPAGEILLYANSSQKNTRSPYFVILK